MMRRLLPLLLCGALVLAACAPSEPPLPTLLPSLTPSPEPLAAATTPLASETPTAGEPLTPSPTATPSATPDRTPTPAASPTPTPSPTASRTPLPPTATLMPGPSPVFATLTPAPPGVPARPTSTGTPQVLADVVIPEFEFQQMLNARLAAIASVQSANIDFTPGGMLVTLSARAGQAISSGEFTVHFDMSAPGFNSVLTVYADSADQFRMVGGLPASDDFTAIAYLDVMPAIFETFNTLLNQRLGEGRHDLEQLVLTDTDMQIVLFTTIP